MGVIKGEKITLRAITRDDLPRFVEWFNDPEVTEGLTLSLPMSLDQEEKWYENLLQRHPVTTWAIEAEDGEHIGSCDLHNFDHQARSAEIGIAIGNKAYWNRGLGTDVIKTLINLGFGHFNLNRVYLCVFERNPRAIRCYEKARMREEGRWRQHVYRDGQYFDLIWMSILREEWQPPQG